MPYKNIGCLWTCDTMYLKLSSIPCITGVIITFINLLFTCLFTYFGVFGDYLWIVMFYMQIFTMWFAVISLDFRFVRIAQYPITPEPTVPSTPQPTTPEPTVPSTPQPTTPGPTYAPIQSEFDLFKHLLVKCSLITIFNIIHYPSLEIN